MGLLNNMLANGSSSYRAEAVQSPQAPSVPQPQSTSDLDSIMKLGQLATTVAAFM